MPLIECSVCLNQYDDNYRPVAGTCGHSFCDKCSPNFNGLCPTCRKAGSFSHPVNNFLAAEMNEQLISSVHSLERRQGVINDLENQLLVKDEETRRDMAKADGMNHMNEWEVIPELGQLQQRVEDLQLRNSELAEHLRISKQLSEHYKNQYERAKLDVEELRKRNSHLKDEHAGFLRREAEHDRKLKQRDEWDTLEDHENVPQPENVVMVLPAMKFISDDTKKHLTDLGIVLIHRADLTSRQLLAASQKQYHETVVPLMNNLVKKAGEIIAQAQEKRN